MVTCITFKVIRLQTGNTSHPYFPQIIAIIYDVCAGFIHGKICKMFRILHSSAFYVSRVPHTYVVHVLTAVLYAPYRQVEEA